MKQKDLTKCAFCGKGMMHNGCIQFFEITISRYMVKLGAVRQQAGLEMMIGGQLAEAMGPNEDMATKIGKPSRSLICNDCACVKQMAIAQMEECIEGGS